MKNYILLIAMVALLCFSSCRKTTINYNGVLPASPGYIEVNAGEQYRHTDAYILANKWVLLKRHESPVNGDAGSWKMQVKGTNNFLIISPVPGHYYWKTEFAEGTVHGGDWILLNVKDFIKQFN